MYKKKLIKFVETKCAVGLAYCAWMFALIATNSACTMPYYEPIQPDELKRLKVNR